MHVIESVQRKEIEQEKHFSPAKTLGLGFVGFVALMIAGGMALSKAFEDALDGHDD